MASLDRVEAQEFGEFATVLSVLMNSKLDVLADLVRRLIRGR
jgi:hypothetical protein